eukprot:TRINITY_DN22985_c0_g1_i1.p1 TRINITY_DN22985_c0_g1~~TRINITY_DN22985_c0_g1_i1.p1  ORF type:complete len:284 (+),score=53.88 TRINITY_DN22985_c0_g1_i1:165-1016(+)
MEREMVPVSHPMGDCTAPFKLPILHLWSCCLEQSAGGQCMRVRLGCMPTVWLGWSVGMANASGAPVSSVDSHAKAPSSALSSAYSHATAAKAPSTPAAAVNSHAGEENVPSGLAPVSSVSSRSSMAVCLECLLVILLTILISVPMLEQIMLQVCSFLFLLCTCTGMSNVPSANVPFSCVYFHASLAGGPSASVPVTPVHSCAGVDNSSVPVPKSSEHLHFDMANAESVPILFIMHILFLAWLQCLLCVHVWVILLYPEETCPSNYYTIFLPLFLRCCGPLACL